MNILQGNAAISVWLLRIIGLLGAVVGIACHFGTWHTIQTGTKEIVSTGFDGLGMIAIGILIVYLLLLLLNSVYAVLCAVLFIPYMLEQVIGVNLLRYMPLETTKLFPALYLYLPFSTILMLVGSFAPVLFHFLPTKK